MNMPPYRMSCVPVVGMTLLYHNHRYEVTRVSKFTELLYVAKCRAEGKDFYFKVEVVNEKA
jgi:hypothetical protein